MEITERLTKVFRQVFGDETIELRPEMTADDVEGWDSFSHINLIIAVELAFGIEFDQREVLSFENVGALLTSIETHL
jgi:acyl carrier protein